MEIMFNILCLLVGMIIGSIFCIVLIKWAFEYEKKLFELMVADETHDPVVYNTNITTPDRWLNANVNSEGDDADESACK